MKATNREFYVPCIVYEKNTGKMKRKQMVISVMNDEHGKSIALEHKGEVITVDMSIIADVLVGDYSLKS